MARRKDEGSTPARDELVDMAARIVDAYVCGNRMMPADMPIAISSVHQALAQLAGGDVVDTTAKPAISIKRSIGDDYIICLEDGARLTMLKRYLKTHFDMTPEQYRRKWGLPADYPMVAPAYARLRSAFAKKSGLGKIPTTKARMRK